MTDQELERRLAQALSHAAPDDLEGVLSRCETRKGTVIPMKKAAPSRMLRNLIAACLALALVGGGGGIFYHQAHAVASVVSLDVNPSIEMTVNRREKILSCTPLNEEAREILADMGGGADLKGTKLDVAVNAIVGSLVRHGYLDSISSAILISVEDRDESRAAKLQQELTAAVDAVLQEQSANASVLSQTLTQQPELETQARENNISTGKAYLVRQVMEMNGTISLNSDTAMKQLSALSVEELNDLLETRERRIPIGKSAAAYAAEAYAGTLEMDAVATRVDPELDESPAYYEVELRHPALGEFEYRVDAFSGEVLSGQRDLLETGSGSDAPSSGDIGLEKAKTAALDHAKVKKSAAAFTQTEREWDDGRLEYELDFYTDDAKYEYTIDAATGAVLKSERESISASPAGGSLIGENAAKAAALKHAGLKERDTSRCAAWLEYDDGRPEHYAVEFTADGTHYEYEIGLYDGSVLSHEAEARREDGSASSAPSTEDIGLEQAKTAALDHAEVKKSAATFTQAERDEDDGRLEYELSFYTDDAAYEYTIDAATGRVLDFETQAYQSSSGSSDVGADGATAAALKHAGLKESVVTELKVERDEDDGRLEYEVEFRAGGMEYEYTIDAATGAVLEHQAEQDD